MGKIMYQKKPILVEALEWKGCTGHRSMFEFLGGKTLGPLDTYGEDFYIDHNKVAGGLVIKTSEGDMIANIGDYIIKEPFDKERKYYPCKPDIFKLTYDMVE